MTKLGGWQRLGLVLAALWCIAVTSFAFVEYREVSSERAHNLSLPSPPKGFVIDPTTHAYFYSWQAVDLLAQDASSYIRDFRFNISRFLVVLLGPIIGLWALASAVGWIIQGFRRT
jgi:hypothetical protein